MNEAIIDETAFENLKEMVGDDFVGELVETFLEDSPDLLAEMQKAREGDDAAAFRRAAHALKSTSASMGALRFADQAWGLEKLAKAGRLEEAVALLKQVNAGYEAVAQALKKLV